MDKIKNFKSGFVSIIGKPNTGKSTLLNHLVGQKIAIISNKPQTTRNAILAIYNDEETQIVFTDTPGIHTPKNKLGEYMVRAAKESANDTDALILVIDATKKLSETEEKIIESLPSYKAPVILVINKIDLVDKAEILPIIADMSKRYDFASIIPVSALRSNGTDAVLSEIRKLLPDGFKYYPDDMITDQPEKQIAAEIIREKLLRLLDKEIPHGIAIEILSMKEKENVTSISANIYCEKASHKGIIIGKNGAVLKRVGEQARCDIEKMLDKKVYLELWVKVKTDWRNSNYMMKDFGYE